MNAKAIYKDYDTKVQEYMQNVMDCLKQDYKEIPSSWRVSLDLIAMNADIVFRAQKDLKENGLLRKDTHGRTFKNQNFQLMMNAQQVLIKLLSSFALTPVSKSKMKALDTDSDLFEDLLS